MTYVQHGLHTSITKDKILFLLEKYYINLLNKIFCTVRTTTISWAPLLTQMS